MGSYNTTLPLTVTPTITGAYSASDVAGGLLQFKTTGNYETAGGIIRTIVIADDAGATNAFTLHLFNEEPTTIADNAAYAVTTADDLLRIASVTIATGDWVAHNSNTHVLKNSDLNYDFYGSIIYGYLVCTGTPTLTAGSLKIRMTVWKNT